MSRGVGLMTVKPGTFSYAPACLPPLWIASRRLRTCENDEYSGHFSRLTYQIITRIEGLTAAVYRFDPRKATDVILKMAGQGDDDPVDLFYNIIGYKEVYQRVEPIEGPTPVDLEADSYRRTCNVPNVKRGQNRANKASTYRSSSRP